MSLSKICNDVGEVFQYKKDGFFPIWRVMKGNPLRGDCEDFSLTVMHRFYGGYKGMLTALWRGHAKVHTVRAVNGKHAVGEINGKFFDNWTKVPLPLDEFIKQTGHKFTKAYHPLYVYWRLTGYFGYLPVVGIAVALGLSLA